MSWIEQVFSNKTLFESMLSVIEYILGNKIGDPISTPGLSC